MSVFVIFLLSSVNVDSSSLVNGGGMIYSVNDDSTSAVNVDACYPPL